MEELGTVARSLKQKAQGLRRSGVRYLASMKVRQDVPATTDPMATGLNLMTAVPAPHVVRDAASELAVLAQQVVGCTRCAELARCRKQTVFGVGNPHAELCFVGEAPGADEDAQGEPFVGAAGKLLTKIIVAMGLTRNDVYICNVLKCRPPGNRTPAPDEVSQCRGYLDQQLDILKPKYICALGSVAAKTLLDTPQSIGRLRGRFHQYRGIPVLCTYHPAYLLRNPDAKREVWEDIQVLMRELGLKVNAEWGQVFSFLFWRPKEKREDLTPISLRRIV
jgi:uracil-DNA glycosylase